MTRKAMLLSALFAAALVAAPLAQAQTPAPGTQPRVTAPPPAAPQAQRVNLNSANASDLDKLPQIGAARAKVIVDERGKGRYKNWDDFTGRMKGTSVNQAALDAIKDKVSF